LRLIEQKAGVLGQDVFGISEPALIANLHRKVASILRYLGHWRQVISGRQLPVTLLGNKGVIARMIVQIGN